MGELIELALEDIKYLEERGLELDEIMEIRNKAEWYKAKRGFILDESIKMENMIDRILFKKLFSHDTTGEYKEKITLYRKIRILSEIILRDKLLGEKEAEEFFQQLEMARDLRNKFAHGTIFFNIRKPKPPRMEYKSKSIVLDNNFFDKYNMLFPSINNILERIHPPAAYLNIM